MKPHHVLLLPMLLGLAPLSSFAGGPHFAVWSDASSAVPGNGNPAGYGIHIRHDDVIIKNAAGVRARITPAGRLSINDQPVETSSAQQRQLRQYSDAVHDIEHRGIQLGMDAAGFALGVVGDVFASLLSDEDEQAIEHDARARASQYKRRALTICQDVKALKQLQDGLAASLPAFRPFAVISQDDANDCERDLTANG